MDQELLQGNNMFIGLSRRMIVLLCSLVLLLSMASCSELEDVYLSLKNSTPIPPPVITEAQALAALDQAVKVAQRKDIDALCELSTMFDYCLDMVKSSGGEESIPQEPPTIVRIESHQEKDGSNTYRISVEGVDGKGQKYKGDFMVFGDWQNPGRLRSPNSVYWSGYSFGWPINGDAIEITSTPEP